jgi:hypothetical protein
MNPEQTGCLAEGKPFFFLDRHNIFHLNLSHAPGLSM